MDDAGLRKIRLQEELDRIVPILREKYQPERIILFGSLAIGIVRPWSDLDLAIIKRTDKRFLDRLLDVVNLIGAGLATDVVVYTPEEFAGMVKDNYFVRDEIIGKGKILYDKNQSN